MRMRSSASPRVVALSVLCGLTWGAGSAAQEERRGKELPRPSELVGINPEPLVRADVPGAPGKIEIVSRTIYQRGAELRRHYHTSQIVFYILDGSMGVQEDGSMGVQEDGKGQVMLKSGDTLLIKPGTVHRHWNTSRTAPLVFMEFILVDEGQRSAVFVE
jgi:quercetin dioxygenase-like cupin family protein